MSDSEDSEDLNEYTIEDYYKIVRPLLAANNINANYLDNHKLLRTLVDFSLSHSLSLKNLQKRELEFRNLIPKKINYVDSLIIETKSASGTQYTGCFRNRCIEFCPHFAIAAYLFSRFHIPDEYGAYEFTSTESIKKVSLEHVMLLKGNSKHQAISYSQQHKSAVNALSVSGLDYKDVNLGKLLATHKNNEALESMGRLSKNSIRALSRPLMLALAGFDSFEDYDIIRNSIEPPQQLLDKIFPFLTDIIDESTRSKELLQIKELFLMLRRSLCQDMVIIKKIYPSNPLSRSEIFNSPEFLNFAQSIDNERLNTIINKSCFIPNEDNIICDDNEGSLRVGSSDNTNSKSASKELKLKTLNKQMNLVLRQQQETKQAIYKFTKSQTEIFQKQNELIQKVNQSLNGVMILLSAQNKTSIPLVQQAAQETQNYLSTVGQSNIERGINNTFELLNVLNSNSGHSQPQSSVPPFTQQPQPLPPSLSNLLHPETLNIPQAPVSEPPRVIPTQQQAMPLQQQLQYPHPQQFYMQPSHSPPTHQSAGMMPMAPYGTAPATGPVPVPVPGQPQPSSSTDASQNPERQRVLHRRLSRQATTLYEMWDDFKGLEKALEDYGISVTEWLKLHGSSERQFRHTRMKIIKFIEDEAERRNTNVEDIKQRLHNKMRNRIRPWTLDEVQRMLTANKRINLDDNS